MSRHESAAAHSDGLHVVGFAPNRDAVWSDLGVLMLTGARRMLSFIIAGLVLAGTLIICLLMAWVNSLSGAPPDVRLPVLQVLVAGAILAVMIAAVHWL
jgi:hypothetical protein